MDGSSDLIPSHVPSDITPIEMDAPHTPFSARFTASTACSKHALPQGLATQGAPVVDLVVSKAAQTCADRLVPESCWPAAAGLPATTAAIRPQVSQLHCAAIAADPHRLALPPEQQPHL